MPKWTINIFNQAEPWDTSLSLKYRQCNDNKKKRKESTDHRTLHIKPKLELREQHKTRGKWSAPNVRSTI